MPRRRLPELYDADSWLAHVAARAVPGLEDVTAHTVRRLVPVGPAGAQVCVTVRFDRSGSSVGRWLATTDADGSPAPAALDDALSAWLGLDTDTAAAAAHLREDPLLAPLVAARPGLVVPGTVDGGELALRTVLGQQVSIAAARTLTGRLVALLGPELRPGLRAFPTPAAVAAAGVDALRALGLTGSRAASLVHLARALAEGLDLRPHGAGGPAARAALAGLPGVGPWTVEYVALRALRDPDAFPAHDLVLRQSLGGVGAREALWRAEAWRPWRGYAAQHLWRAAAAT